MEFIWAAGQRLELLRIGAPAHAKELQPIVFLHEGLGSVAMWRDWPARLCAATGRAGLVYSRQGYGGSEAVSDPRHSGRLQPDYLHREALQVLPALLAAVGVASPVLVGHSDGGSIALIHAAQHELTACVVMAPHVMVEDLSVQAIAQARDAFEAKTLRERLARYHTDVDGAFWRWNDIWLSPAFRTFDIRAECRRITAPVLALQGEQDPYGSLAQIEQIEPDHGPIEREVLPACGHSPHRDAADITTERIKRFLAPLD